MFHLVVVLIDPVDLGSTVVHITVLLPCPEVESLLQALTKLSEGGAFHVAGAEDVVHVKAE